MVKKIKLSILLVYYGEKKELLECLDSIRDAKLKINFEVIVVNNSADKKIEKKLKKIPWVKYIKAPNNLGYGRGINLAVGNARGEYIFTLNPDTKIYSKTIENLLCFAERKKGALAVSPMLVNKSGKKYPFVGSHELNPIRAIFALSFLNKVFPNNAISRSYWIKTKDKRSSYEVDVLPGIFLIKKDLFEKLGGFDEKLFLYFEDTDFFKRLKDKRNKLFVLPTAKVIHYKSISTSKIKHINKIFEKSRFYYFKKHFGYLNALLVEGFLRFNKQLLLLLLIILLGSFLRLYRLQENYIFQGELGFDYYSIKNYVENRQIPLLGPPTSHPWFALGPIFYWIFSLFLPLVNYNPLAGEYFMAIVGISAIILGFTIVREFFGNRAALISSFLIAVSPFWLGLTRGARFNFPMAVLFFPLYYFLTKTLITKGKYFFWSGLFLGLTSHFFGGYFVLVIAVGALVLFRIKDFKRSDLMRGFVGFLIPLIPFLIHNAMTKFDMLIKITMWIPYRILGFVGLYPKNTATPEIIQSNFTVLYDFFANSYVRNAGLLAALLFIGVLVYAVIKTKKSLGWSEKNIPWLVLVVLFVISYLGIFVHGDPPLHYFLIVFPIPVIFLSIFLSEIFDKKGGKIFTVILLSAITIFNFRYYFSDQWFFRPQEKFVLEEVLVPYNIQEKVVQAIFEDAQGVEFELGRVGPYDQFEYNYALNYHFLLWRLGNEPVDNASIRYTIYEDTSTLSDEGKSIFWVDTIAIEKEEK